MYRNGSRHSLTIESEIDELLNRDNYKEEDRKGQIDRHIDRKVGRYVDRAG